MRLPWLIDGSVSKDRRKQIEEQLKRGELRCVVATSSLELGIDMGSVDLVVQVPPHCRSHRDCSEWAVPTTMSAESRTRCSSP